MAARGGYPLLCAEFKSFQTGDFCLGEIPWLCLSFSNPLFIVITCHLKIYFLFSQMIKSSR